MFQGRGLLRGQLDQHTHFQSPPAGDNINNNASNANEGDKDDNADKDDKADDAPALVHAPL